MYSLFLGEEQQSCTVSRKKEESFKREIESKIDMVRILYIKE